MSALKEKLLAKSRWMDGLPRLVPEARLRSILSHYSQGLPLAEIRRMMGKDGEAIRFTRKQVEGLLQALEREGKAEVVTWHVEKTDGTTERRKFWRLKIFAQGKIRSHSHTPSGDTLM